MGENDPVTEKACDKRHRSVIKELQDVSKEIKSFVKMWNGNGTPGVGFQHQTMWEHYQRMKKSTQGFVDWLFRAVVMILLTFVAVKLGLK